ncbi:CoA transferase [Sulfuricystis multivorans]|uniref:CoA transferase n=1 Tax=Sulfuricystis multivorans TaxID=2211108 RepID=UPI000F83C570|nr:CoA transferase [Sulfuricystis multivorans]
MTAFPAPAAGSATASLAGLKVLDLIRLLPGLVCPLHLTDVRAEVIEIDGFAENGAGDYARTMGLGAAPGEDSFFFRIVNRNKRSLRLDLKQPAGVEVFLRLARKADGLKQFAPPLRMSSFEFAVRSPVPKLGADGTALLCGAGYLDSEIAELRKQGVI